MIGRRLRRDVGAATASTSVGVRDAESTGTAPNTSEFTGLAVLEARGLVKRYGDHPAVDGIDLDVQEGEVFALLGPNGAGKTTTLEMREGYRPVPTPVFLGDHLVNPLITSVLLAIGVAIFPLYGVPLTDRRTLTAIVTVIIGAMACAAAFPFTRLVGKATAASPMTVAVTLTLFFLSGNFFPGTELPRAMSVVADLFPVRHFFVAMVTAFNPDVDGGGFEWTRLAVLAAWAIGGAVAGARLFRWTPTEEH